MPNSTITLQNVVDYVVTLGDIAPAVQTKVGGYATKPVLMIANAVAAEMFSMGFPWKFNRMVVPMFLTTSYQQDYALQTVSNLSWIEHGFAVDINSSSTPKPHWPLEGVRDLEASSIQWGIPEKVCWLPNDQLTYGTWGAQIVGSLTNIPNPGAGVTITNPLGVVSAPSNPICQIQDTNGNYLIVTQYGTCGSVQPTWPAANAAAGTTVVDGSVTWTVVNPKYAGFRIWPIPPQSGVIYAINLIAQMKPPIFTSFSQTLEPIPDDFAIHFMTGFVAQCYRHTPDPKVRTKFPQEWQIWKDSLAQSVRRGDRERDDACFYPARGIMDAPPIIDAGPLWPWS